MLVLVGVLKNLICLLLESSGTEFHQTLVVQGSNGA
ncbi:hypothetical protein CsSME_00018105 [Camellia sinensis var. sinensis]